MRTAKEGVVPNLPRAGEEVPVVGAVACEVHPTPVCRRPDEEIDVPGNVSVTGVDDVNAAVAVEVESTRERSERRPPYRVEVRRAVPTSAGTQGASSDSWGTCPR